MKMIIDYENQNKIIRGKKWYFGWNNWQIKIIWGTNKIIKKIRFYKDYDDKELKSKYFKIQFAAMSDKIDEKLFEKIFGHALIKLIDKLINTTKKRRKSNKCWQYWKK